MSTRRSQCQRPRVRRGWLAPLAALALLASPLAHAAGEEPTRHEITLLGVVAALPAISSETRVASAAIRSRHDTDPGSDASTKPAPVRQFCTFDDCRPRRGDTVLTASSFGACILGAAWLNRRRDLRSR